MLEITILVRPCVMYVLMSVSCWQCNDCTGELPTKLANIATASLLRAAIPIRPSGR